MSDERSLYSEDRVVIAENNILPMLALRGLVVFSGVFLYFDVGRDKSVKALEETMNHGQMVFLVAQKKMATAEGGARVRRARNCRT